MYVVAIGWLYVALMMAVAEATNSTGTVLGGIVTFLLYGVLPTGLVMYLLATPARRRARKAREAAEHAAWLAEQAAGQGQAKDPAPGSQAPDAGSQPAADAVAPVRKEP
jgi:hypothetical protein